MYSSKKLSKSLLLLDRSYIPILSLLLILLLLSSHIISSSYRSLAFTANSSFVQTDKKSYVPGEDINIQGKINQTVSEDKNARIDIYDPKGGIVLSNINEPLDEKNNFKHTVSGAYTANLVPGKYEILVTYNRETASQADFIIVAKGQIPQ